MNEYDFNKFCQEVEPDRPLMPAQKVEILNGTITFGNSSGGKFPLPAIEIEKVLERWSEHYDEIKKFISEHIDYKNKSLWEYQERTFRSIFKDTDIFKDLDVAIGHARSQTKGFMSAISKYVGFYIDNKKCQLGSPLLLDKQSLALFFKKKEERLKITSPITDDADYLKEAFSSVCSFCKKYDEKEGPYLVSSPDVINVFQYLKAIQFWAEDKFNGYNGIPIDVKISRGSGNYPRVPWICILPPDQKVSDGIYVAICFGREGGGAVAGCAESVANRKGINIVIRSKQLPIKINVNGGDPATYYNDAFENPLEITPDSFNVKKFYEHIQQSLDICLKHLNLLKEAPPSELLQNIEKEIIPDFITAIANHLIFKDSDIKRFIVSLLTKPFVILTGNSGTGKTKIAQLFAKWISQNLKSRYALVPVGSDWTDNRNLIGFLNLLRKDADDGNGVFQTTPVLDLTLSALNDPSHPYFLILDEMNLSHVERYFSDYLSAMESMEAIPVHNEESEVYTSSGKKIKNKIAFPTNMFVIGTVNIDETTYMFSPKVLDRANVIEFQVDPEQFISSLSKPLNLTDEISVARDLAAESLLNLSYKARNIPPEGQELKPLGHPPDIKEIIKYIGSFFDLLSMRSMEFAFRTSNEILRYLRVDFQVAPDKTSWDWKVCLDIQVLQKILPKLHGSRRKLEAILVALATLCETGNLVAAKEYLKSNANLNNYFTDTEKQPEEVTFRQSYKKLNNMIDAIRRDQFVSFIQ